MGTLVSSFQDPAHCHSLWPFWTWSHNINSDRLRRQLDRMIEQHVYGAIIFPWPGMPQPYLSDEYFALLRSVMDHARMREFSLGIVCDFCFPQGECMDVGPGEKFFSRMAKAHPEFVRKRLRPREYVVSVPTVFRADAETGDVVALERPGPIVRDEDLLWSGLRFIED